MQMDGGRRPHSTDEADEALCGSFKARLKSGDGSLYLFFSPFTALWRRLGASWPRSGLVWLMRKVVAFFWSLYWFGYFRGVALLKACIRCEKF